MHLLRNFKAIDLKSPKELVLEVPIPIHFLIHRQSSHGLIVMDIDIPPNKVMSIFCPQKSKTNM